MPMLRKLTEALARKTTRRKLFGRGADVAFGTLAGVAAGSLARSGPVSAVHNPDTVCDFPGPPCACDQCVRAGDMANGVCAKPCVFLTTFYASGCWITSGVTCCDCDCQGNGGFGWCGCGSDYHNDPAFCPGAGGK